MNKRLLSALDASGLTHFANAFETQGVDDSLIDDLNDADLQAIGVAKLGDRKKLLKAFASCSPISSPTPDRQIGTTSDSGQDLAHVQELEELIRAAEPAFTRSRSDSMSMCRLKRSA